MSHVINRDAAAYVQRAGPVDEQVVCAPRRDEAIANSLGGLMHQVRSEPAGRFLNAETQNINVPGMLFLPADGVLPAKLSNERRKL
jgi:hypothetical protein